MEAREVGALERHPLLEILQKHLVEVLLMVGVQAITPAAWYQNFIWMLQPLWPKPEPQKKDSLSFLCVFFLPAVGRLEPPRQPPSFQPRLFEGILSHQAPIAGASELNSVMQLAPSTLVVAIALCRSDFGFRRSAPSPQKAVARRSQGGGSCSLELLV